MTDLMRIVLILSASGTVLALALAALRRLLRNKLPKAVFYYLWLLVLLRLIVPAALPVSLPQLSLPAEDPAVIQPTASQTAVPAVDATQPVPEDLVFNYTPNAVITGSGLPLQAQMSSGPAWYETAWQWLCAHFAPVWLTGAAVHFLWFLLSYLHYRRRLLRDGVPLLEHEQALFDELRADRRVTALRSPLAQTPLLVGLLRPRIFLPETPVSTRELECILRHELTHLSRRDLLYKWFAVAATSFHWFNPLMPWLRRELSRSCELACDEAVIRAMDEVHRRQYGETLLTMAAARALPRGVPATMLCEEKRQLKERLQGILWHKRLTAVIALLSLLLALGMAGCAAVLGPQWEEEAEAPSVTAAELPDGAAFDAQSTKEPEAEATTPLYNEVKALMEQEFHRVYDPYYDILSLELSDWQETDGEATFTCTMTWQQYERDVTQVAWLKQYEGTDSYETMCREHLAQQTGNFLLRVTLQDGSLTLYANESVVGDPVWTACRVDDFILKSAAERMYAAYGRLLWDVYDRGLLPDGTQLARSSEPEYSSFALADVDGDGSTELILRWQEGASADLLLVVYGWRDGSLYEQGRFFPQVHFYSNGALAADWSHNQGPSAEDFWPYDAYSYDETTDTWQRVGSADSDGQRYYLLPADWEGSYSADLLVDETDYLTWRKSWLQGGTELELTEQALTAETIADLGAPRPSQPTEESAG